MTVNKFDFENLPCSDKLNRCLQSIIGNAQSTNKLTDGLLTARVVGEFSAGKTRFLRELFGELIPEPLFPISSLERQTRLPLEITYAETPKLTLIEKAEDYSPVQITKTLSSFPDRQSVIDYDTANYRLRLAINEPRLILQNGDGYSDDNKPKRLFLIDTPGWNSGDDDLAERDAASIMAGFHNLALIYVSQASRIDGANNAEHLREFLDALAEADFLEKAKLLFIVTSCPTLEIAIFEKRVRNLVSRLWEELGNCSDELEMDVLCIDFADVSSKELNHFRSSFWHALLGPLQQNISNDSSWSKVIKLAPNDWDIIPRLSVMQDILSKSNQLLDLARQGDDFIPSINKYLLIGLNISEIRKKVRNKWLKQLDTNVIDIYLWSPGLLPETHPLLDWWGQYWLTNFKQTMEPVSEFFYATEKAINELTPENIDDIKSYFYSRLSRQHIKAQISLQNSFASLVSMSQSLDRESDIEKRMMTLFSLSILQARYDDYEYQNISSG
ncbi:hypothetical protein CXF72_13110 [Psychromonas sp. MB-3u-54]|uniref:dynamin family protein n=1 Tax=Psychromonas sp. MB-3u-54 TaxID=2058319 RepID=UPI000C33A320|nr:dynamin family protein [Psychromonas sp. MB-3u-54]PKH02138.1 hypothetical protein CXF72_13110 [Psychromonas sp. MB-3u-54]